MLCPGCLGDKLRPVENTSYIECGRCGYLVEREEDPCYRVQQAMLHKRRVHPVKRFWQRYQGQILGATLTAMLIIGIIGFGR